MGTATDVETHFETLDAANNGASYGDIRDGRLDPFVKRRLRPTYRAERDEIFPDLVRAVFLPDLWSRRMVEVLNRVAPDHQCLIFPARIVRKGLKSKLPWTHSLVVPLVRARDWIDVGRSEAKFKSSNELHYPTRICVRKGWEPIAPVMALDHLLFHDQILGVTEEVAKALLLLEPHGVFLAPVEDFSGPNRPSCSGRTDPAGIAAWKEHERIRRGCDPVPLTDWEVDCEMFRLLRKDRGIVLWDGQWVQRCTDFSHQEWLLWQADGGSTFIEASEVMQRVENCLARWRGLSHDEWRKCPRTEALEAFNSWQKETGKERRFRQKR